MKRPEQALQISCVKWFRMQYPKAIIHHSPNGGGRSNVEGGIFKAMGVLAGFPDLIIIDYGRILFVELKSSKGRLNENQQAVHEMLAARYFQVHVVNSFDSFKTLIDNFLP